MGEMFDFYIKLNVITYGSCFIFVYTDGNAAGGMIIARATDSGIYPSMGLLDARV